jgi:hypothetical protein
MAMRAVNDPGGGLVTQESELLLLQPAFRGGCCRCADVRRGAGEYEADSDVGTFEC